MTIAPEFSRTCRLDQLDSDNVVFDLAANSAECAALAERFDLISVSGLAARVRLRRLGGKTGAKAEAKGHLQADVVQRCVVTLAPVPAHVETDFHISYVPAALLEEPGEEIVVDLEDDDIEPLDGEKIDLGEAVAQHLSLALDPYPRAAGAELPDLPVEPEPEPKRPNPFTVLKHKG